MDGIDDVDFLLEFEIEIGFRLLLLLLLLLKDFIKSVEFVGSEEDRKDEGVVEEDEVLEEGGVIMDGFFKKLGLYKNGLSPGIFGKIECNLCWFDEAANKGLSPE